MSKKRKENLNEEVKETAIETVTENVSETTEVNTEDEGTIGVVTNCKKLNVRNKPDLDGKPITTVNAGDELDINLSRSTKNWYSVTTKAGNKGYCMKKYVKIAR